MSKIVKACELIKQEANRENLDLSSFDLKTEIDFYLLTKLNKIGELDDKSYLRIINKASVSDINTENLSKLKHISEKLTEENYHNLNTEFHLKPKISPGDRYIHVKAFDMKSEQEKLLLKENGVTVIYFWAEWCGPCVRGLKNNFIIIENNYEYWKDLVEFCAISINDKATTESFIQENHLNRFPEIVSHYLIDHENSCISKIYGIEFVPFIIVVDQKGILRQVGNVSGIDIEDLINDILKNINNNNNNHSLKPQQKSLFAEDYEIAPEQDFVNKFFNFEKEFKAAYAALENKKYYKKAILRKTCNFGYDLKNSSINDFKCKNYKFSIDLYKEDFDIINKLLNKIFTSEEIQKHRFKVNLIETFDLEISEQYSCIKCKRLMKINSEIAYTCKDCKIFFCFNCVNSVKDNTGLVVPVHKEHNLIAFKNVNKENLKNIETYKLGKNLFSSSNNLERIHDFTCNSCQCSKTFNERYICLNCRPGAMVAKAFVDVCAECFQKIYTQCDFKCLEESHKSDHVYLHLLYGNNYYIY